MWENHKHFNINTVLLGKQTPSIPMIGRRLPSNVHFVAARQVTNWLRCQGYRDSHSFAKISDSERRHITSLTMTSLRMVRENPGFGASSSLLPLSAYFSRLFVAGEGG